MGRLFYTEAPFDSTLLCCLRRYEGMNNGFQMTFLEWICVCVGVCVGECACVCLDEALGVTVGRGLCCPCPCCPFCAPPLLLFVPLDDCVDTQAKFSPCSYRRQMVVYYHVDDTVSRHALRQPTQHPCVFPPLPGLEIMNIMCLSEEIADKTALF